MSAPASVRHRWSDEPIKGFADRICLSCGALLSFYSFDGVCEAAAINRVRELEAENERLRKALADLPVTKVAREFTFHQTGAIAAGFVSVAEEHLNMIRAHKSLQGHYPQTDLLGEASLMLRQARELRDVYEELLHRENGDVSPWVGRMKSSGSAPVKPSRTRARRRPMNEKTLGQLKAEMAEAYGAYDAAFRAYAYDAYPADSAASAAYQAAYDDAWAAYLAARSAYTKALENTDAQ